MRTSWRGHTQCAPCSPSLAASSSMSRHLYHRRGGLATAHPTLHHPGTLYPDL
jgi:hypothetical protein